MRKTALPVTALLIAACLFGTIPMDAQLRITAPDPVFPLLAGQNIRIEWSGNGADNVALWYSTDGGGVWLNIAAGISGASYDWQIPADIGTSISLRVSTLSGARTTPLLEIPDAHDREIRSMEFSPDGSEMLSAGRDGEIQARRTADGGLVNAAIVSDPNSVYMARYVHGPAEVLITQGEDLALWQRDVDQVNRLGLTGHTDFIRALAVHPARRIVATAGNDGSVRVWDIDSRSELRSYSAGLERLYTVAFSPDGSRLAFAGQHGSIHVRRWESEDDSEPPAVRLRNHGEIRELPGGGLDTSARVVWSLAFGPRSNTLVSGGVDFTARLWDALASADTARHVWRAHTSTVWTVDMAPDGVRALTASLDQSIRQWDAASGAEISPALDHGGAVLAVAYSPSGDTIVSAGRDNAIRLWASGLSRGGEDIASYDIAEEVELYIPHLVSQVNRRISVPVLVRNREELELSGPVAFMATISTPATLLSLETAGGMIVGRLNNSRDSLRIALELRPDSDTVGSFRARVLLGAPTTQAIRFEGVHWGSTLFEAATENGSITIEDDCEPDSRLVALGGTAAGLLSIVPNPARERARIQYLLPEDGPATLEILSLRGEMLEQVFAEEARHGVYERELKLDHLPAGEYFLRLRSLSRSYTAKFVLID